MTTATTLAANKTVGVAFSLCFEGLPYVFCTGDAATMRTAFAGVTDFSTAAFYSGLHILGTMGGKVSPWDPSIDPDSLDFTITEQISSSLLTTTAGVLASTFLKAGHAQTTRTFLEANVDANDVTFEIQDQSVMTAATATAYIGNETITYTGKVNNAPPTTDQLTGVTRGKYALHLCNDGTTRFSTPHRLADSGIKPVITNGPRSEHYGRQVMLRVHSIDPLTGAYDTVASAANALTLWVGRIKSYRWNGNGTMTFSCEHVIGMLKEGRLFSDQFRANLAPGQWVSTREARVRFREFTPATPTDNIQYENFLSVDAQQTADGVRTLVDAKAVSLRALGSLAYEFSVWDGHVICTTFGGTTFPVGARIFLALNPEVWDLLGYNTEGHMFMDESTGTPYRLVEKELSRLTNQKYTMERDFAPVAFKFQLGQGHTIVLESAKGTWTNQPTLPTLDPTPPSFVEGFVQVGGYAVAAVRYDSATQLTSGGDYSNRFAPMGFSLGSGDLESGVGTLVIRGSGPQNPIRVKQIWWEKENVAKVLLRFLLSTGTTGFNHTIYDKLPYGLGLGVPASLVNIPSFQSIGSWESSFFLSKPEKFVDFMESALALAGKYCVWQDGKITLRPMTIQSENLAAAITFTESNKASGDVTDPQRLEVDYSSDGMINRVVLEYNRLADGTFKDSLTVEDSASVTDFGSRGSLTVKGYSIGDVGEAEAWIDNVAASVLAFWSRPLARARRTFTFQEIGNGIACGDTVLLSDSGMINPSTGLHGVTNIPACVVGWSFDWESAIGEAELILMPGVRTDRIAAWAPTARIVSYVAATRLLTLEANQYSHSSEARDATRFAVGDRVRMTSLSPANPAAPGNWQGEIVSVESGGNNQIVLITDPTSGAGLAAGVWNLQYDTIAVCQAAGSLQARKSFIADDATDSTGDASSDSYMYGSDVDNPPTITFGDPDYAQRFTRIADITDDTAQPFSVGDYHDAVKSLNCLLGSVTNTVPVTEYFETAPTQTGTTYRLVHQAWIPCMGGTRALIVALHGYHSVGTSSASFRVTLSPEFVEGTSLTAAVWSGVTDTTTITTASTTVKALAEATISTIAPGISGALPAGLWMSIEIKAGAAAETATLVMVNVREASL